MPASSFAAKRGALLLPLFLLIITTIYLATALQITPQFDEGLVGPSFVPVLVSILMYIALGFVFRDVLKAPFAFDETIIEESQTEKPSLGPAIKIVVSTAIYIAVLKILGYPLSTFLYVYALLFFFKLEKTGQIRRIAYSAVITAVFYVLFAVIFQVRLPMLEGMLS